MTKKSTKKSLTFFNSFEELNDATAFERAQRTPDENFAIALVMIKKMYAKEIANAKPYRTLNFRDTSNYNINDDK